MGTEQENLKLDVTTTGGEKIDSLAARMGKVTAAVAGYNAAAAASFNASREDVYELADAYEVLGEESTGVFTTAQQIGPGMRAAAAGMNQVEVAAVKATGKLDQAEKGMRRTKDSTGNLGRGFLELSRGVEDAQYGLAGVLNNLPSMISMFGGPAGLAAVVSLTAVGLYAMRGQFTALNDHLNDRPWLDLGDSIATFKKRLDELTEKPHKLDVDYSRLDDARKILEVMERKLAAFKAIGDATDTQEKVGKAVTHVIREEAGGTDEQSGKANLEKLITAAGGLDLQDEAVRTSKTKKGGQIREAEARLAQLKAMKPADLEEAAAIGGQINTTMEDIAALRHDLKEIVKEKVDQIIGGAAQGVEADRRKIADLFDRNRALFERGDAGRGILPVGPIFRQAIEDARAENVRRQEEEEAEEHAQEDRRKNDEFIRGLRKEGRKKADDAEKKRRQQAIDDLTKEGALDAEAARLTAATQDQGLAPGEAFAKVRAGLAGRIQGHLAGKGLGGEDADEQAQAAGEQLAGEAFTKAGIREKAAEGKAARAVTAKDKKDFAAELAAGKAELDAQLKEAKKLQDAEAARVLDRFGGDALALFRAAIAADRITPPEQLAGELVRRMTQEFQAAGARAGAAQQAARKVAARAGFAVPERRIDGPPRVDRFGRPVRQAGAPKPKPKPKPKAKAPAAPAARPRAPVMLDVDQERRQAERRKVVERADAEAARRRKAAGPARPAPGPQAALGPIEGTQQALGTTQQALGASLGRLAKVEQDNAHLNQLARRLAARAGEQAPTAQNSGSSTA